MAEIMIGEWYDRDGTLSVSIDTEWYKTGTVTWKSVQLSETGRMIQAWWTEKESPTIEHARAMLHDNRVQWHGDQLHIPETSDDYPAEVEMGEWPEVPKWQANKWRKNSGNR